MPNPKTNCISPVIILVLGGFLLLADAYANEVNLTEDLPFIDIRYAGKTVRIERNQDTGHLLDNSYAKTSRPCPPFCIHPMQAAPGVITVGELELFDFLLTDVRQAQGLLIDARIPEWYHKGTIPGAVNIPFTVITSESDNTDLVKVLKALGGKQGPYSEWDFSSAVQLLLFCNGPWCDQSPRAIKGLMRLGYPPEKLKYYRGGMQNWQLLGLTTIEPTR